MGDSGDYWEQVRTTQGVAGCFGMMGLAQDYALIWGFMWPADQAMVLGGQGWDSGDHFLVPPQVPLYKVGAQDSVKLLLILEEMWTWQVCHHRSHTRDRHPER